MKKYYIKPLLAEVLGPDTVIIRKLRGGMMNMTYQLQNKKGELFLIYIPFQHSNDLVNRKEEKNHYDILEENNFYTDNIYFDVQRGIKINRYIPGLSLNLYKGDIDYDKIANQLHLLHDIKTLSNIDYMPLSRLATFEHALLLYEKESNDYKYLRDFISSQKKYFLGQKKCLCHNDAQRSNFIIDKDGNYHLIDFEFMANNDPYYDIATFGNDSIEEMEELLRHYDPGATSKDWKRLYILRIFISLQWHALALVKYHHNENKDAKIDFRAVANHFIENAKEAKAKFDAIK